MTPKVEKGLDKFSSIPCEMAKKQGDYTREAIEKARANIVGPNASLKEIEDAATDLLVEQILRDSDQRKAYGNPDRNDVPHIRKLAAKAVSEQRDAEVKRRSREKGLG